MLHLLLLAATMSDSTIVSTLPRDGGNSFYHANRAPLNQSALVRLPVSCFQPKGWLLKQMELQRDGLTGHLGEISIWLTKEDNAWLSKTGEGKYGWEEVPYWLRGYSRVGYVLHDPAMEKETKFWVEGVLASQRPDGDFGPKHYHGQEMRDLWGQMLMVQVLQGWYEHNHDARVIPFLTNYFKWELAYPEEKFLKDYWENSRGGDNLASVYWLYNRTGDVFLLDLAAKIDRNTANWRQKGNLPNWHNVNVAECFREPATFWQQSGKAEDWSASYADFDLIRTKYGQVPGGMFGADENAREGYDDPRQATETCGFVEQLNSNVEMTAITGDPKWTANSEDVAFNSLPAAFMPDYKSLRYLTAPNMALSDAADHSPGIQNGGPFLLMNPFSSRCCQHNHTSAWINFMEGTWMGTQDNGLACLTLSDGDVTAKVGSGQEVKVSTTTKYPFEGSATMKVSTKGSAEFPLYVLVPKWAESSTVSYPGGKIQGEPGKYVRIDRVWKDGDEVKVGFEMAVRTKTWTTMKDSMSVEYGPLTMSLKIPESFHEVDPAAHTQGDSGWQPGADKSKWPAYEILPQGAWNYGLEPGTGFDVVKLAWPKDNMPFTLAGCPIVIKAKGAEVPGWGLDKYKLVAPLPQSPVAVSGKAESLTLVPMGAARLRISAFPQVHTDEK